MAATIQPVPFSRLGFDPAYLPVFEDKVFIEGPQTRRRLVNFFALLLLATIIATYGVLSNSTATVIGAMIVAPLMGPIMAVTAAVVMGSEPRALRSLALTAAGIFSVILFSFLLAWIVPELTISFVNNGEIASRINPGLYALLTALGAGAAGSFITSRAEIADSIGGVAIAISLVPPLCVVGISLRCGNWAAASGAFLLFMTNLLAILLAGGIAFVVVGLGRLESRQEQARVRRRGFLLFVISTLVVAIPLSITTYETVIQVKDTNTATVEVQQWLQGTNYQIVSVSVDSRQVIAAIEGDGEMNSVQQLANRLATAFSRPVVVNLVTVPARLVPSTSP